jgi:hypothetical protein
MKNLKSSLILIAVTFTFQSCKLLNNFGKVVYIVSNGAINTQPHPEPTPSKDITCTPCRERPTANDLRDILNQNSNLLNRARSRYNNNRANEAADLASGNPYLLRLVLIYNLSNYSDPNAALQDPTIISALTRLAIAEGEDPTIGFCPEVLAIGSQIVDSCPVAVGI